MRDSLAFMSTFLIDHPMLGRGSQHNGFYVFDRKVIPDCDRSGIIKVTVLGISFEIIEHLRVQSSRDADWEHVSVSLPWRCPTWDEMAAVKSLFWKETECVMQLHVPAADHRNLHPYCLHLWRPRRGMKIPRPPADCVAPAEASP